MCMHAISWLDMLINKILQIQKYLLLIGPKDLSFDMLPLNWQYTTVVHSVGLQLWVHEFTVVAKYDMHYTCTG
jgi:hypothetical protein